MKHQLLTVGLIASSLLFTTAAQADRPCKPIVEACMSAGVIQSGASRQVMLESCVKPVVSGKMKSVKVDASVIKACRAKIADLE